MQIYGLSLTPKQRELLSAIREWMLADKEYAESAAKLNIIECGLTKADRGTWQVVSLACDVYGLTMMQQPIDAMGLATVIDRHLAGTPLETLPDAKPRAARTLFDEGE